MENNSALHIKTVITGVIATLTALWGWFGWLVIVWVCLMLADWLVGSAVASKEGRWSSAKLREGAWHKGGMIVIVCVALVADWLISAMMANLPGVTLPFDYTVLIGMNFRYEHRMVTDLTRLAHDHDRLVLFRAVAIADFAAQTLPGQACVVVDCGHTHLCLGNVG